MSFYSNLVLPYCIDFAMSGKALTEYRQRLLQNVSGEILEIGFGTGLNLPYYPDHVSKITTIDPNPGMGRLARSRIDDSQITVDYQVLNGESLPMADCSFDSVVCTWTLCSIVKVNQAIGEIYRLLKSGGKFFFIEHGLSQESQLQIWQNRLTPIQKIIADGCHLNRNIEHLVKQKFDQRSEQAPSFYGGVISDQVNIEQFYAPKLPKVIGYMYQGIATK